MLKILCLGMDLDRFDEQTIPGILIEFVCTEMLPDKMAPAWMSKYVTVNAVKVLAVNFVTFVLQYNLHVFYKPKCYPNSFYRGRQCSLILTSANSISKSLVWHYFVL